MSTETVQQDDSHHARIAVSDLNTPWRARLRGLARRGVLQTAVGLRAITGSRPAGGFGILMYHRVADPIPGVAAPTWNVSPARLRRQLRGLRRRGFTPRHLSDVLTMHEAGASIPPRTFVVTFDDGYANNLLAAAPILRELGVPATVFLATAYLDSSEPFPSDDWSAAGSHDVPAEAWRPLTTDECREMALDGLIELGAHTHTHADFRDRPDALYDDLLICREELRSRFGINNPTFAFPYGTRSLGFSGPLLAEAVRRAGLRCSLTTESELVLPATSPFDWGRFTAEETDTAATLAAKLDGWYERLRKVWRRCRYPFEERETSALV